jgi:hypothetical protein
LELLLDELLYEDDVVVLDGYELLALPPVVCIYEAELSDVFDTLFT